MNIFKQIQHNIIFLVCILISQSNLLTINGIIGTALKDCKIKFMDFDWQNIDDCDTTSFNRSWGGGVAGAIDIRINYNIGDIINIWIKAFNNVPLTSEYEDFCSIYMNIHLNEYYIHNERDYIYYCTNCD